MARASVRALLASNWIEIFAVPIAAAVMETQPIVLILPLLVPRLLGSSSLLDTASITGLMLYFQWWAMFVMQFVPTKPRSVGTTITRYDLFGIVLGLTLFAVLHIPLWSSTPTLIVVLILSVWFWKRGKDRARVGLDDEQLITEFKIGFALLAIMLLLAFLSLSLNNTPQSTALSLALPIYFLAGIIALSFTRIGKIQQESARHPGTARKETTSTWLLAMTVAWIVLIIISIALEVLPSQILMFLLLPLNGGLTWLAHGLLYVFGFLIAVCIMFLDAANWLFVLLTGWLFHSPTKNMTNAVPASEWNIQHLKQLSSGHSDALPLWFGQVGIWIVVVCILSYFIHFVRKRAAVRRVDTLNEESEMRETLNRSEILKARRNEQKQNTKDIFEFVTLDPISVRARYRDFLLSMAARGSDMLRQDQETPAEYQQRLLTQIEQQPFQQEKNAPADIAILTELTSAYARERYGAKELDNERHNYLNTWVPVLVQRLIGKNSPRTTADPIAPRFQRKTGRRL